MRTTVDLDDELLHRSKGLTGIEDHAALIREALRALIELKSRRSLASLGGTLPELKKVRRSGLRAH